MIIGSNFRLNSRRFLDARQQCESLEKLNANEENILYPYGFEVFCVEEGKWYQNVSEDNTPIWEQRKGGVGGSNGEINIDDIIEDGEVLSDKTWSSEYINGFKINLEQSIIDTEDYVAEIEDRVIYIEGQLQWFETFDGSYNSLTDKPIIPSKISDLENDSNFVTTDDVSEVIDALHTHENLEILNGITEEKISLWDNMVGSAFNGDYNFLENKPIEYIGDDSEIKLNLNNITSGNYIITNTIDDIQLINELVIIDKKENELLIVIPKLLIKIMYTLNNGEWVKQEKINYQVDKDNANISNSLNIGTNNIVGENNQIVQGKYNVEDTEGKYINIVGNGEDEENRKNIHTLDWEGNAWYNGKVSQEGVPTEDKDLVTKGYVDGKFATSERVEKYIEDNDKENARRDVIIDALANGRRRTIDYVDGEADLFYATEKDDIFIDKIEGETLVNVCDQEEPIAITKSYTVENTNHVALQGEYDGKCRPVVYGNTLVNRNVEHDKSMVIGNAINESGTEVNINGTANSEVEVSLDGHTALNLGTKKGGELCKSFESASGNEIKLTTDRNSKTDVVCQGDTLVNLCTFGSLTAIADGTLRGGSIGLSQSLKIETQYTVVLEFSTDTNLTNGVIQFYNDNGNGLSTGLNGDFTQYAGKRVVHVFRTNSNELPGVKIGMFSFADSVVGTTATISNIMVFEGDLTQTPELIPTKYVKGIQSTFEDKYIPYSIYNGDNLTSITETQYQLPLTIKTNTEYTVVTTINTTKYQYAIYSQDSLSEYLAYENTLSTATFSSDKANISFKVRMNPSYEGDDYNFVLDEVKDKFLIVEGNWQGRENLLTSEYFGKYKVDMSSVGKNLFDKNILYKGAWYQNFFDNLGKGVATKKAISVKPNTEYTITFDDNNYNFSSIGYYIYYRDNKLNYIGEKNLTIKIGTFTTPYNCEYLDLTTHGNIEYSISDNTIIQIEEGTVATEYEPYCGTTKTVYLNSPLYEGDELLTKDGKIYHYHKMGSVVLNGSESWEVNGIQPTNTNLICFFKKDEDYIQRELKSNNFVYNNANIQNYINEGIKILSGLKMSIIINKSKLSTTDLNGFKQWLSENPTTVVYELANPYYEEISTTEDMIFDIATSSTLSYESAVPMGTTSFLPYTNELPLLETSTQYRVSFDCDVVGLPLVISLGGTTTTITSELHNTLSIITPSIETNGKLTIDGSGIANIDNVVVTKGEMVYEYFEGLESSFEGKINFNKNNYEIDNQYYEIDGSLTTAIYDFFKYIIKVTPNTTYSLKSDNVDYIRCIELDKNKNWICRAFPAIKENADITFTTSPTTHYLDIRNNNICNIIIQQQEIKVKLTLTTNDNNLIFGKGGRL